jgi:hypothetical protein
LGSSGVLLKIQKPAQGGLMLVIEQALADYQAGRFAADHRESY